MVNSWEDLVNQALRDAGLPMRVQDAYEGSSAARVALEIAGQARDELIAERDWSFSRTTIALGEPLKGPPPNGWFNPAKPWSNIYAPPGFVYTYAYPSDCLKVCAIYEPPGLFPDSDPLPAVWRIDDDLLPNVVNGVATGPEAKIICCNLTNAMMSYRRRVTNPSLWPPGFVAALVASLGEKFAAAFGADPNAKKEDQAEAVVVTQTAGQVRG